MNLFLITKVGILNVSFMQSLEMTICHALTFVAALVDQSYNSKNVFSLMFKAI